MYNKLGVYTVKTKRIVVRVDRAELDRAHELARVTGQTLSEFVRALLAGLAAGRLTIQEAAGKQ